MLAFPASLKIYLAREPVDMRKQFDGLWAVAQQKLGEDPREGALFVFVNKRRTLLKMLYFDRTGPWIFAKRLERGRFSWPSGTGKDKLTLSPAAVTLLINGIELRDGCRKAWYER